MKLAVFDLDHTLLPIDSGDAWSHWLVRKAGLDEEKIGAQIEAYAQAYRTGHFVPLSFIRFQFGLLAAQKRQDLEAWRASFIDEVIRPAVRPEALQLVAQRRLAGYEVVLATGTHRSLRRLLQRSLALSILLPQHRRLALTVNSRVNSWGSTAMAKANLR